MPPVFVDGLPARITVDDFRRRHLESFPKLSEASYDQLIQDAIDDVYTMFHGVQTLWDWHDDEVWFAKTQLAFLLLTAWHLLDSYPTLSAGVVTTGGLPLKRKKIGGVDIQFADSASPVVYKDYQDLLGNLKSNPFGVKVYSMLRASGKRALLGNRRMV
jgi:hypothetical protein